MDGGHFETKGVNEAGEIISVPLHRHEVGLDFWYGELSLQASFEDAWSLRFRVPFSIKDQSVEVNPVDPATEADIAAMERNGELHHRDETYQGIGDLSLLVSRQFVGIFDNQDIFELSVGTSVPTGKTEEDPLLAGREGRRHLHIQFGNGTFDPLLEASYGRPVIPMVMGHVSLALRTPLYENSKKYRASSEFLAGGGITAILSEKATVGAQYQFLRQGFAEWNGVRDNNTGLKAHYLAFSGGVALDMRTQLNLGVRFPLTQSTLVSDGDTFEQGVSVLFGLSRTLRESF
ncbi:MAG: hypothetical protein HKN21_16040 [Candidatus Eisenbacteria bacterium]|uniref:Uncharacterized protein n=1 Tax=Eiseniibacteriota bacterium TaxID=2212470 RepID=A0A7Y2H3Z9_UNCEI|nr:hypothetical protein [Candidatus Eisenbacteria bacterium]